ncbi:MAG: DUF21 domain-containing protein [Chitinispirillia bacterium]|nr:DUF21 domain-containing protein [Chitinispirillia bacterium]MCL2268353.1 DUF21 domain-containing protein [Chitinispirillia bacterium]
MLMLIILLLICIFCSWFFAGCEIGFISWNPLKVAHAAGRGNLSARMAMRLMNHRGQVLSVILAGNNVVNVAASMVFAALFLEFDRVIALDLSRIPSPESLFLTPVLIIFGEILPKSLYRTYPFRLTMKFIPALTVLFYIVMPLLWVLRFLAKPFVGRRQRGNESLNAKVREDIVLVAVEGARRGSLYEGADLLMRNTMGMTGKRVEETAVSLDEWKRNRAVYRSSQMLTEFGAAGAGPPVRADEVVVFDDERVVPVGYVSLLDAAAHHGDELRTFGSLLKPLPRLRGSMGVLAILRRMPPGSPRYYSVVEGDSVVGILDKMALFEAAFAKSP